MEDEEQESEIEEGLDRFVLGRVSLGGGRVGCLDASHGCLVQHGTNLRGVASRLMVIYYHIWAFITIYGHLLPYINTREHGTNLMEMEGYEGRQREVNGG